MFKPFSLQILMDLAVHEKESATLELGKRNKQHHNVEEKLELLRGYRSDYQARLQVSSKNGMDPAELRNFHEFINKLDEAIAQQLRIVEQSKALVNAGRCEFDITQRKVKSYSTLQERHEEEQRKIDEKSEQHSQDEFTGRSTAIYMHKAGEQDQ